MIGEVIDTVMGLLQQLSVKSLFKEVALSSTFVTVSLKK